MANLQRDVFLRSDIKNSLEAIKHANAAPLSRLRSGEGEAYREGFNAAIESVAIAFNIEVTNVKVIDAKKV